MVGGVRARCGGRCAGRVVAWWAACVAACVLVLAGCVAGTGAAGGAGEAPAASTVAAAPASGGGAGASSAQGDAAPASAGDAGASSAQNDVAPANAAGDADAYRPTEWDPEASPEYYRVVGPANVADAPAAGEVRYGGLDALGRTQRVVATVDYAMYQRAKGHEPHFDKDDDPSGWGHNARTSIEVPTGKTYHGYFWNRSHLLADSLGGAASRENLVTGTRTQNVGANDGRGGMAYEETRVRDWLSAHPDGTVYYAATPAYVGDELVPRSVFVDVRTSDGAIDEQVEVYNAALGHTIDYATGEFM